MYGRGMIGLGRPGWGRWMVALAVLCGYLGLLGIQARALPGEMPRATLERLAGIRLAVPAFSDTCGDMAGMAMAGMPCPGDRSPDHAPAQDACPLCPLLHLSLVVLPVVLAALCVLHRLARVRYSPARPRAPPVRRALLRPPAIGPPLTI
ncbi:hypothetical protein ACLRDC_05310 [Gluconacetobacter sacchari]